MRALLLAILLELSLPCLAQVLHATPPAMAAPARFFAVPSPAQSSLPKIPQFDAQYWTAPSRARSAQDCDPMIIRPRSTDAIDKGFVLTPPSAPAQTRKGCAAPKLQMLAAAPKPRAPFQNLPDAAPRTPSNTLYLTSTASLRFSHGLQLLLNLW